jgi:hypothetical protein
LRGGHFTRSAAENQMQGSGSMIPKSGYRFSEKIMLKKGRKKKAPGLARGFRRLSRSVCRAATGQLPVE